MIQRMLCVSVAATFLLAVASSSFAQINLTNGTTTYTWDASTGTGIYNGPGYEADILVEESWYVRFEDQFINSVSFRGLNPNDSNVSIVNSTNDSIRFDVNGDSNDDVLEVQLNFSMNGNGDVEYLVEIFNDNFGAGDPPNEVSVFNYFDMNLAGTNSGTASASEITITGDNETYRKIATDADAFQVSNPFDLRDALTNNIGFNLNNNGLLDNSDVVGVLQWDHTVPFGGNPHNGPADYSFGGSFSGANAIPEPNSAALGLFGMGVLAFVRRRKS